MNSDKMVKKSMLKRSIATEFDVITKVMIIVLVTIASYFAFLYTSFGSIS